MDSYQHSWITFSLKMIRYEFFYSPSILSILMSSHTFPIFSSRSVVERRGGGEEPGRKGIQSFSIFSLLLYKKDNNSFTCANSKLQSCWSKTVFKFFIISATIIVQNNCYVFLQHANSLPSLAKVENKTKSNQD